MLQLSPRPKMAVMTPRSVRTLLGGLLFLLLVFASLCFFIGLIWVRTDQEAEVAIANRMAARDGVLQRDRNLRFSLWPPFSWRSANPSWYSENCFPQYEDGLVTVEQLGTVLRYWRVSKHSECREILSIFHTVYSLTERHGELVLPPAFKPRVARWLGGRQDLLEEVTHQVIRHLFNEYTYDQTIYNPLRAKRPVVKSSEDQREVSVVEHFIPKFCIFRNCSSNDSLDEDSQLPTTSLYHNRVRCESLLIESSGGDLK